MIKSVLLEGKDGKSSVCVSPLMIWCQALSDWQLSRVISLCSLSWRMTRACRTQFISGNMMPKLNFLLSTSSDGNPTAGEKWELTGCLKESLSSSPCSVQICKSRGYLPKWQSFYCEIPALFPCPVFLCRVASWICDPTQNLWWPSTFLCTSLLSCI